MAVFWDVELEKYLFAYLSRFCFKFKFKFKVFSTLLYFFIESYKLNLIQQRKIVNWPMNYAFVYISILSTSSLCLVKTVQVNPYWQCSKC